MNVSFPILVDGREVVVTQEVKNQLELFEFIADMQDVFGNTVCVRNGQSSSSVKLRVRQDEEENKYYEMFCYSADRDNRECQGARKSFGCHKSGKTLFPKGKDKDGAYLPNNGWMKWNKETQKEE